MSPRGCTMKASASGSSTTTFRRSTSSWSVPARAVSPVSMHSRSRISSPNRVLSRAFSTGERGVTFALLKGWRNYLCLSRLEQARAGQESLFDEGRGAELESIAGWAARTSDGSLSDLVEEPSSDVWDAVAAESDLCTRLKCPHFDRCFVFAARRRAAEADGGVVNHHLLASDLAVRIASDNWQEAAVLPPYRRLVLDEAHHLEDVAAHHLGTQVR